MVVWIGLLRGVNVGGKGKLPMAELRELCQRLGCVDVNTYIQSGNIVFRAPEQDWLRFAKLLEDRIAQDFGVTTRVILRSPEELQMVIECCPFLDRQDFTPTKLQVTFLERELGEPARTKVLELCAPFEEVQILGREMFGYFANGVGASKLPFAKVERALGVACTARNWNTVGRLLAMSQDLRS